MPVINVNGNLVRFDDDLTDEQISAEIEKNPTLFDPSYKAPVSMTDRLKGFARTELGFDPDYGKNLPDRKKFADYNPSENIQSPNEIDDFDFSAHGKNPELLDYAKGFAAGANNIVSGIGYLAELAGADRAGKEIRKFGDRGAAYWNKLMSPGGQLAAKSQVFVDDEESKLGFRLGDNAANALLMGAASSAPSMVAAGVAGIPVTRAIQGLASLGLAGGSGATIPLLAGTAAPIGTVSKIIASTPSAIGFGLVGEGVVSGAMNAAQLKSSIESMSDKELSKSPVYNALKLSHGEDKAKDMLADQATQDLFGKTTLSTGIISMLTGGGALGQAYQKVTVGSEGGLVKQALKGGATEFIQETPQSGGEKYIQNITSNKYLGTDIDPMSGVVADALSGGATGALTGAVFGGAAAIGNSTNKRAQSKADRINAERVKLGLSKIESAKTVDEAISAAQEVNSQNVTKDDVLRTEDPNLADIERLTGLKPSEAIDEINAQKETVASNPKSFTIIDKNTGEKLFDTDEKNMVDAIDTSRYEAIPTDEYNKRSSKEKSARDTEIVLPDNTSLKAQWDIVDADSVKASLKEGQSQPRDRTRAVSNLQIQSIANNPDYRRLSDSPVMDVGASVLSHDGQIVGGNGRFEALSRAYDQNTAQDYLDSLRRDAVRKGLDPSIIDSMNKPILVRRISEPFDTRKLAIASNSGTSAPYSARENAKIDAERIGDISNLDITDSGDIALTPRNMQIIRDSMKGYTSAEQSSFVDSNGNLSQEGAHRFRNAILYNAYGDSETLTRLIESTDNDMRNVAGALMRVSGDVAKVRQEIKQGAIPKELDITDDLIGAVEKIAQLRSQNIPVQEYLSQQDIFGNGLSDDAKQIVTALHDNIRSQNKIAQFIRDVYDGISRVNISTGDMLGNQIPSKGEVIQNAKPAKAEQGKVFAKPASNVTTESRKESAANAGNKESGGETAKVKPLFSKKQGNLDKEYLAAVESGDLDKAQKMVDDYAREKGYISGNDYRMQHQAPNREDYNLATIKESGIVPKDYWTHPHYYQSDATERDSFRVIITALNRQEKTGKTNAGIAIYRAVPKNVKDTDIRNGDWVSPSREYARQEGEMIPGGYRIIQSHALLKNLWWDANSINELGYDDGKEYAYKNTKNNRKSIDAVTYDDEGNIIPLSKRFNARSDDVRYSKSEKSVTKTLTKEDIQPLADKYNKKLTYGKIIVLNNIGELPEGTIKLTGITESDKGLVEGAYLGRSKVYIIAQAFDNLNRVDMVIQHELSHLATEELLDSKEYAAAIKSVNLLIEAKNETILNLAAIVKKRQPKLDTETRAKEILAMSVETGKYKNISALRRVVADLVRAFKAMLRRLGVKLSIVEKMSEQEVFATMRNAMDMLYSEKNAKQTGQGESLKSAKEQIPETLNIDGKERPTRNSNGQLIHPTEEGIRNFWKWFGDGYFLDPNGKPYIFYHQTSEEAAANIYKEGFRTDLPRARKSDPRVPDGVFLKPNEDNIGVGASEEKDIAQIPLYANIKNPFIVKSAEDIESTIGDKTYSELVKSYEDTDKTLAEEFDKRWAVKTSDREEFKSFADEYFPRANRILNDIASQARERLTEVLLDKGYDGVIISNDKGSFGRNTKTIVALDTNQVKSATDNNGAFSKQENSILLSKAPKEGEASLDLPEETFARALQRKAQDKFNRFNVIKEFLEKEKGIKLSENADVYRAEERYHSKVTNQIEDFRDKVRNPLIEKIAKADYTLPQVEEYLKNRHAQEANVQIRKLSGNDTDTAYGITDEQAKEYLDKAPKELAKLADEVQAITKATQQLRLDNGLETQERIDAMNGDYKYYVPVRGDFEEQEAMRGSQGPGGRGFDVRYRPKRRLGHAARNEDVIGNIFQDYERAIVQVEKNRVAKSLALMAAEIQMPDLISIDQPVKRKVLKTKHAYGVVVGGEMQEVFHSYEAAEQNKKLVMASNKKIKSSDIEIIPVTDQRLIYAASPSLEENEVMAYMNGHEIRIQIKDDLLAQAYKNLGVEALPTILRVGRAMNGWMSKAYTGYNPEFIVTNIIRDFTSGIINLTGEEGFKMAAKSVANYPKSFSALLKYAATGESNKWIDSYRANGGNTGAAYLSDLERLGQEINGEYVVYQGVLKNLKAGDRVNSLRAAGRKAFNVSLKYIEHLNQAGENAFRLATFRAMIESGKSVNEAAHIAKNVTINFNRKGELGAQFNAAYLFFNANLQGSSALAHALFAGKHKYQAWGLAVGGLTTLGYMIGSAVGGFDDPEKYDAISDAVKSRNLIFAYGDGYVKIPVPYGAGFFYNVGRVIAEAQRKGDVGKLPYQLAAIALEEFSPFNIASSDDEEFNSKKVMYGLIPTVPRIPLEIATNFSTFTGREMYPEKDWYKSEPDNEKMWRNTKGTVYDITAQFLAKAGVEISPETLKYLARTATGGSGTFVDSTVSAAMLKKEGAELETREIPFVRKAYGELTIQDMRQRYSKAKEEAITAAEKFNAAMRKNDLVTAKQLMGDKGELIALKNYADKLSDTIKYLRDMQDSIKLSEYYTVAEKRLKIKELEKQEEKFYNQYLDIFKTKKFEMKQRQEK